MTEIATLALSAGIVAAVNPCGFAMLPAYLALIVSGESRSRAVKVGRALAASAAMTTGFVVVFGIFGLVIAPAAASIQKYLPAITVLISVALVVMGVAMLAGKKLGALLPAPSRGAPTRRLGSMFGYGIAFAIASLSCTIGPFLAVSVTALRSGDIGEGLWAFFAYAVGMGLVVGVLVVGVLAVGAALATNVVAATARRALPYMARIGGGLLVLTGAYVAYYGFYELRLSYGGGTPADPIIDGASRLQGRMAELADAAGPASLLVTLVLLAGIGVAAAALARRRRGPR